MVSTIHTPTYNNNGKKYILTSNRTIFAHSSTTVTTSQPEASSSVASSFHRLNGTHKSLESPAHMLVNGPGIRIPRPRRLPSGVGMLISYPAIKKKKEAPVDPVDQKETKAYPAGAFGKHLLLPIRERVGVNYSKRSFREGRFQQ